MLALLDRALGGIAQQFSPTAGFTARERWEFPVLLALLIAGAVLRFWGLGDFSLHKPDEDTTVLAALNILKEGLPRFPSGMYYARAPIHSYLIAASVAIFGYTEWSYRLPSALCGLVLIALSYFVGRRFLAPRWNLAFVACVAFLPGMIADSQEARMYGFLMAGLATYLIALFRWERSGRRLDLCIVVLAMFLSLQFQPLAVLAGFLLFFPALIQGKRTLFFEATAAFLITVVLYFLVFEGAGWFYPKAAMYQYADAAPEYGSQPLLPFDSFKWLWVAMAGAAAVAMGWMAFRRLQGIAAVAAVTLLVLSYAAQANFHYHLSALFFIACAVVALHNGARWKSLAALAVPSVILLGVHLGLLHSRGETSLREITGMLSGSPSPWTLLQLGSYSPVALFLIACGVVRALWQLAQGQRIPDFWMLFVLGAWLPLLLVGFIGWYFPPRYIEFALLPMLICALASLQDLPLFKPSVETRATALRAAVIVVVCAAIVNPQAVARVVKPGYDVFADHKGAAEFMRSIKRAPTDVVIAEEVLMQTHYLGRVDYWLVDAPYAAPFVLMRNGVYVDIYTHTPVLGTADELKQVLQRTDRGTVYVVGSGENLANGEVVTRGKGIAALLKSDAFQEIYVGRDGVTKVWKVAPGTTSP